MMTEAKSTSTRNRYDRSGHLHVLACVSLLQASSVLVADPGELTPQELRHHVRTAQANDASMLDAGKIELVADVEYYGDMRGTTSTWCGVGGAFLSQTEGPVSFAAGYDGDRGHAVDFSGRHYELALEGLDLQKLYHWVRCGYWVHDDAPVEIRIDLAKTSDSHVACIVSFPETHLESVVMIDKTTWLPVSIEHERPGHRHAWTFGGYETVHGEAIAHQVTLKDSEGNLTKEHVRRVVRASANAPNRFSRLATPATDTRFDATVSAFVEAERLPTGHMVVRPLVNGTDIGWFILDTGADAMCIDTGAADTLGLPAFGRVGVGGVGGSDFTRVRRGRSFQLGPVTIDGFTYFEYDLSPYTEALGRRLGGVIGYDLFSRIVAEIDFAGTRVSIHDPAVYSSDCVWHKFIFSGRCPTIPATFEGGRAGLFPIDTGATSKLTFHSSTRQELQPLFDRATQAGSSRGLGGAQPKAIGTLAWFAIADQRFTDVRTSFSLATAGTLNDPYTTGTIGAKLFEKHILTLDYGRSRLALTRSKQE